MEGNFEKNFISLYECPNVITSLNKKNCIGAKVECFEGAILFNTKEKKLIVLSYIGLFKFSICLIFFLKSEL